MLKRENNFDYYHAKGFPKSVHKPNFSNFSQNSAGAREFADAFRAYESKKADYTEKLKKYHMEQSKLDQEFRSDLEEEYSTSTLPKEIRDALFNYAYENGHAYGYSEVSNVYGNLMEIVTAIENTLKNNK